MAVCFPLSEKKEHGRRHRFFAGTFLSARGTGFYPYYFLDNFRPAYANFMGLFDPNHLRKGSSN